MYDKRHLLKEAEKHKGAAPLHSTVEHETKPPQGDIERMQHKDEVRAAKLLQSALTRQLRIANS